MSTAILSIPRLKQISYEGVPMTKDKTYAAMQQYIYGYCMTTSAIW